MNHQSIEFKSMLERCKRVYILGVDGIGNSPSMIDTPNFNRVVNLGASTLQGQTAFPPISAECWGTMLLGIERHC